MDRIVAVLVVVSAALMLLVLSALFVGLGIMWTWNYLVPTIFHGPEIGFIQAVGLYILCQLLFTTRLNTTVTKSK